MNIDTETHIISDLKRISVCLHGIKFVIYTKFYSQIQEILSYLAPDHFDDQSANFIITFNIDRELEKQTRIRCGKYRRVYNKSDLFYWVRQVEGAELFSSSESFHIDQHSIVKQGNNFSIIGHSSNEQTLRTPLRVVREIIIRSLENSDGCFTHAAAFRLLELQGSFIVIGDSGKGKTTTMFNALKYANARYIANDRLVLTKDNDGAIVAHSLPFAIRLGMGLVRSELESFDYNSQPWDRSQSEGIWTQNFRDEHEYILNWGNQDKLELTPKELVSLHRGAIVDKAEVRYIIIPNLKIGSGPIVISRTEIMESVLDLNLRTPFDEDFQKGWLGIRKLSEKKLERNKARIKQKLNELICLSITGDPTSGGLRNIGELLLNETRTHHP